MDYREATIEERNVRLHYLSVPGKQVPQDVIDKAILASNYLNLERCQKCLRLRNVGYVCCHCENAD